MSNYKTIPGMLRLVVEEKPNKKIINYKTDNKWKSINLKDSYSIIKNITSALRFHGFVEHSKIAILSSSSYKWSLCDYGILCNASTTVTIYPTLIASQIEYILQDSETSLVFVEDAEQLNKIVSIKDNCPLLKNIILLDDSSPDPSSSINFCDFIEIGSKYIEDINFDNIIDSIKPDDLMTLIYTSGTTGTPKGVMLSHMNLISNINAVKEIQTNLYNERFLSFLPLSHVLERMAGHFFPLSICSEIFYAESMESVGDNMIEVSPTVVIAVPRFFEKIYAKIILGLKDSSKLKVKLFNWSLKVGKDYINIVNAKQSPGFYLSLKRLVADKLIYSKVRAKLGGKIKFFISGGAPLSSDIAEFFAGIGILILEGYGLTETSPVLTSNTPEDIRFGYVGKPLKNVEVRIASDGEILAKGPNIMLGYYNNKIATDEVIDSDGWFYTGDIGEIDNDGFVKITDRKKSIIVTSAGKNIAPAPLENAIKSSNYVDQVMVIGDKRNFISALIVPDYMNVNKYLNDIGKDDLSNEAIIDHPDVIELFNKELNFSMKHFAKFETIKKYKLCSRPFAIERGEMTPKMSVVRKKVLTNFNDLIDSIYNIKDNNDNI